MCVISKLIKDKVEMFSNGNVGVNVIDDDDNDDDYHEHDRVIEFRYKRHDLSVI